VVDEIMSTDEGLKPEKKKDSCPSAKADGNICMELFSPSPAKAADSFGSS
jgi:hypothetical protein